MILVIPEGVMEAFWESPVFFGRVHIMHTAIYLLVDKLVVNIV